MSDSTDDKPAPEEPSKYVPQTDGADPYATRLVRELKQDRGLLACRYNAEGTFVFTGAQDYFVHRWDLARESPEAGESTEAETEATEELKAAAFAGHESWVRAMCLFPQDDRLATGDYVGRVIIWQEMNGDPKPQHSIAAHEGSVRAVSVSADGKQVASAGNDQMVRVWSAETGKLIREFAGHDCHVYNVAFHPDGSMVSADLKCRLKHWNVETGELIRELDAGLLYVYSVKYTVDVGGVRGMSFNADGSQLACTGASGVKGIASSGNARVLLFDWESGELLHELKPEKDEISIAWGVRFHPDGFIVASGGSRTGGYLWFWQPDQPVAFHMLKFRQRAPGFDLDLSPDGKTLAVANHDGALRLYEMTPEPVEAESKGT